MDLRYYQQDAITACWEWIRTNDGNPCIVIPTGGGKSLVMASLARQVVEWKSRCLILAHVKELVEQNAAEINSLDPSLDVGIYSAGLNSRQHRSDIVSAGIQSVYGKSHLFQDVPDIVLVDECHLINPAGIGRYREFLSELRSMNPNLRTIGLTATPYRTGTGSVVGDDCLLDDVCYEVGVSELITAGFLSNLISKTVKPCDTSSLPIRRGEFVSDAAEELMMASVESAVSEMLRMTADRRSVLVFAQSLRHCWAIEALLQDAQQTTAVVTGKTVSGDRSDLIEDFKLGRLKYLINCNVLTTGFNARGVDCVALMRPTVSPGLYYQMVGRGFRLSPETKKQNCLILDYGGNIKRHGPVDSLIVPQGKSSSNKPSEPITKTCTECKSEIYISAGICPDCGHVFPAKQPKSSAINSSAADDAILSDQVEAETYPVQEVLYSEHKKKGSGPDTPKTLRVDYICGLGKAYSEWICVEHDGYAGTKARKWWDARTSAVMPSSAARAAEIAKKVLPQPVEIAVRPEGRFSRIEGYEFGDIELPLVVKQDWIAELETSVERQPGDEEDDPFFDDMEPSKMFEGEELPF